MLIDVTCESLPGDRIRYRWTDTAGPDLCEVIFDLDELAAMERREFVPYPAPIRRWRLDDAIARVRAEQDQIEAERTDLLREHPDLEGEL